MLQYYNANVQFEHEKDIKIVTSIITDNVYDAVDDLVRNFKVLDLFNKNDRTSQGIKTQIINLIPFLETQMEKPIVSKKILGGTYSKVLFNRNNIKVTFFIEDGRYSKIVPTRHYKQLPKEANGSFYHDVFLEFNFPMFSKLEPFCDNKEVLEFKKFVIDTVNDEEDKSNVFIDYGFYDIREEDSCWRLLTNLIPLRNTLKQVLRFIDIELELINQQPLFYKEFVHDLEEVKTFVESWMLLDQGDIVQNLQKLYKSPTLTNVQGGVLMSTRVNNKVGLIRTTLNLLG